MHIEFIRALNGNANLDTTRENLSKRLADSYNYQRQCISNDYQNARFLKLGLSMPPESTGYKVAASILKSYEADAQDSGWYGLPKRDE